MQLGSKSRYWTEQDRIFKTMSWKLLRLLWEGERKWCETAESCIQEETFCKHSLFHVPCGSIFKCCSHRWLSIAAWVSVFLWGFKFLELQVKTLWRSVFGKKKTLAANISKTELCFLLRPKCVACTSSHAQSQTLFFSLELEQHFCFPHSQQWAASPMWY